MALPLGELLGFAQHHRRIIKPGQAQPVTDLIQCRGRHLRVGIRFGLCERIDQRFVWQVG